MNLEDQLNTISKDAKLIRLSTEDKESVRLALLKTMQQYPARQRFQWFVMKPVLRYSFLASFLLLFGVGGISVAANSALPGELLYPIKTKVNEKVLVLVLPEDKKAQYQVNLVSRRLEEIEKVALKNKLDDRKSAKVNMLLNQHIQEVKAKVQALKNTKEATVALEINSQLESLLQTHTHVIDKLFEKKESKSSQAVQSLLEDLKTKKDEAIQSRISQEVEVSSQWPDNGQERVSQKIGEALHQLAKVRAEFVHNQSNLSPDSISKIEADLASIEASIQQVKNSTFENNAQTFINLQHTIRVINEVRIRMKMEASLENLGNIQ